MCSNKACCSYIIFTCMHMKLLYTIIPSPLFVKASLMATHFTEILTKCLMTFLDVITPFKVHIV